MPKLIKKLLERNSLFLAITSSLLILVLSLINLKNVPSIGNFAHSDKIKHLTAYAVMSFFWMLSCKLNKVKLSLLNIFIINILFGIIIEVLQMKITTYRTGDLLDILANTVGVCLGYVILRLLRNLYLQV